MAPEASHIFVLLLSFMGGWGQFPHFIFYNMYFVECLLRSWQRDFHTDIQYLHKHDQALRCTLKRSHHQQRSRDVCCDHIINSDAPEPWAALHSNVSSRINKCQILILKRDTGRPQFKAKAYKSKDRLPTWPISSWNSIHFRTVSSTNQLNTNAWDEWNPLSFLHFEGQPTNF